MKARPVKYDKELKDYALCGVEEATHVEIFMPVDFKPLQARIIPVITKGSRDKSSRYVWSWNGDTENPTFKPSILTQFTWGEEQTKHRCHSFVNDGMVKFLSDCSHENVNKTLPLLDIKE